MFHFLRIIKVKKCGKCYVRVYCGRECQKKDWSPKGPGQGHKNWCGLPCGEQDVDWKVVLMKVKGRGIFALRKFPARSRIMVDAFRVKKRTEAADQEDEYTGRHGSAFVNHACDPNASELTMDDMGVVVIYAERDIEEGEEICKTSTFFNSPLPGTIKTVDESRAHLLSKYIYCPENCFCRKEGLDMEIERFRKLYERFGHGLSIKSVNEANLALKDVEMLLTQREVVKASLNNKVGMLLAGFNIAVQQKKTLPLALNYVKEAYKLMCEIGHPQMLQAREIEDFLTDLKSAPMYLKLEK